MSKAKKAKTGENRLCPKGTRFGGRAKGTPNKTTASVKAAILGAFDTIGGAERLAEWAEMNPDDFYTKIWVRVLPQEITGADGSPLVPEKEMSLFEAARTFAFVMNQAKLKMEK